MGFWCMASMGFDGSGSEEDDSNKSSKKFEIARSKMVESLTGRIRINDGIKHKMIFPDDLEKWKHIFGMAGMKVPVLELVRLKFTLTKMERPNGSTRINWPILKKKDGRKAM